MHADTRRSRKYMTIWNQTDEWMNEWRWFFVIFISQGSVVGGGGGREAGSLNESSKTINNFWVSLKFLNSHHNAEMQFSDNNDNKLKTSNSNHRLKSTVNMPISHLKRGDVWVKRENETRFLH